MKMNKINTIISVLALSGAAMLSSCNDIFRDSPVNAISEEDTWSNAMLLDEYVNSWYRGMSNGFKTYVPSIALVKSASRYYLPWFGDQITVAKSDWFNAGYGDLLKGSELELTKWATYNWGSYFNHIYSINQFLENSDKVADGDQKTRITGEAHFMRAYYYYILWRMHGGVMIIDHSFNPLEDAEKFPRATYQEMVDFIVSEAQQAADILPQSYSSTDVGRATKGAAIMLKAKAYLWASSQVFQNRTDSLFLGFEGDRSSEMLQKAKSAYEELFALNQYSLIQIQSTTQDGIRDEYRKIFTTKNTAESIFEVQHSDDGDYANKFGHTLDRDAVSPYFTGTTAAYTPTQNHVDEYGMRDGKEYDKTHPYANRDYRFYANVLYDSCMFRGHQMDLHYTDGVAGADLTVYGTSTSAAVSRTGYYMGKFVDETQTIDDNDTYASKQNYIIWRYAEALLDYAEVCYRLGDAQTATTYVNKIRSRVHMDEYTSPVTWDQIYNERRIEMAFEETTYWDIFRMGLADEIMNGSSNPLKAMKVEVKNGRTTYTISNLNRFPKRIRYFQHKQYYLPIPWAEIKYHGVAQNPGWSEV